MHELLALETLQKLPEPQRNLATAALSGNHADFIAFLRSFRELPAAEPGYMLPLIYALLDTAALDPTPSVDSIQHRFPAIRAAMRAVGPVFCDGNVPAAVFPDLWPRIWAWFSYILAHTDNRNAVLQDFIRTCGLIKLSPAERERVGETRSDVSPRMFATPGLFRVVGEAWAAGFEVLKGDEDLLELVVAGLQHREESEQPRNAALSDGYGTRSETTDYSGVCGDRESRSGAQLVAASVRQEETGGSGAG
ncbi:hypothetical protein MKEN_00479400 [Mycena kentingensis (nom. inval.)]|nr:hypothetical protein MKEN_00479400 [Mycena kentingensis (nom. inval.)]